MKNKIEITNEEELYPRIDAWHYLKDELPEVGTDIVYAEHHVDMPYVDYYECIEIDKEDIKNFYAEGDRRDMWAYTRRNIKEDDLWRKENVNFSLAQANNPNWREYEEQRRVRGFDDTETWSLDITIAKFILPRLKVFKDVTEGYPACFGSEEAWQETLDDMIYWLERYVDEDNFLASEDERETRGRKAFAEYFSSLWW